MTKDQVIYYKVPTSVPFNPPRIVYAKPKK